MQTLTETTFAPSELIALRGEEFASKGRVGNSKLLHGEAEVSTEQLARAVLAAAILANEQAGTIRLETRSKKAWLGLRTVQGLFVEPTGSTVAWPEGSLESDVVALAKEGKATKDRNEVAHVVSGLLRQDTADPWAEALALVSAGLFRRDLLEQIQKKTLKIFTSYEYILPEATRQQAAATDVSGAKALLQRTEQERPELWKLLQEQIRTAVGWRTEDRSDHDYD